MTSWRTPAWSMRPSQRKNTACGRNRAAMSIALISSRFFPEAVAARGNHSASRFLFGSVATSRSGAACG